MNPVTIDELRNINVLNDLPDEHLQWIIDHTEYHEFEDGTQIKKKGDPADKLQITLEGKVAFYLDINGRLVYYFTYSNDEATGGVGGLLPHSRMKTYPGNAIAVGKLKLLQLDRKYFEELEHLNPALIQKLIGLMTERAKLFATTQMQQEKVNALGQLSAGIAHELNNPASAVSRMSSELHNKIDRGAELTEKLLQNNISPAHIKQLRKIAKEKISAEIPKLSGMKLIEKEDEIRDWLEREGIKECSEVSETFIEAGLSENDVKNILSETSKESFSDLILWLENYISSQRILRDIEGASGRISGLVGAIKSHVNMDRTHELQRTDIHKDIANTLTLLGYKLRDKNISVRKEFAEDAPEVNAFVGELNQVWTNIIDNAIYALPQNGEIIIRTGFDGKNVSVKIIDNGPGIPPEILSRIFDPFFTTKKVGDGTGIGLDLVSRIIKHHKGQIKASSKPGCTEFTVIIPV